jgi:hypothetical protein
MATPPLVTVTGTIYETDGVTLYNGTIQFKQPVLYRHTDGTTLLPGKVPAVVVDGALSVQLYTIDAPGWGPQDWAWEVQIQRGSIWKLYGLKPSVNDPDTVNFGDLIITDYTPSVGSDFAPVNHTHPDLASDAELAAAIAGLGATYATDAELAAAISGLTKTSVGLANVDNTSDATKPISAAQLIGINSNIRPQDYGLAGWTFDPIGAQAGTVLATAGLSYVARLRIVSSTVSAILLHFTVGGSGLTAGQCLCSLHNDAGAILGAGAVTVDQSAAWASGGLKTCNLSVAQGVVPGDFYKIRFWFNGTIGPTISREVNSASAIVNLLQASPNFRYATADAGLTTAASATTTFQNIGAMTGGATAFWVGALP